ncbi:hypothetical protein C4580_05125 [Candidatus Woesearchaeota archaeon]|nr:MAG: hypothetical protein C4580_05125 [Candidatus Woesearchaeota archaeon]
MPEDTPPESEEYELLPHKEIEELKSELSKLKEFELTPSKKMHVSLLELNTKLDKLLTIFEDAAHEMRVEEGGLSFAEKMRPLLEKMNKILEQNSEIASGILALADLVKEMREPQLVHEEPTVPEPGMPMPSMPANMPPLQGQVPPGAAPAPLQAGGIPPPPRTVNTPAVPPLPPLPRKRTFGL